MLNIGGFMACQRFVSHVTGFSTFFGYDVSGGRYDHAWGMLAVPLFFLFGVMISGFLVDVRLKLNKQPKYFIVFGCIFLLILSVYFGGIFNLFGTFGASIEVTQNYWLLVLLCLACGMQNGTVTTVSKSIIRTTHLSGMTTDLGLGLVRILSKDKLKSDVAADMQSSLMRIGIIFFFGLGSVAGGFAFRAFGFGGFLFPSLTSGILFILMLYFKSGKNVDGITKA